MSSQSWKYNFHYTTLSDIKTCTLMATNNKVQPILNMESNEIQTINAQDSVEEATVISPRKGSS